MVGIRVSRQCFRLAAWSIAVVLLAATLVHAVADDWPTFRNDSARSGWTAADVSPPLHLRWALRQAYPPQRIWSPPRDEVVEGNWEKDRIGFDAANHVAVVGDAVFLASSGDSSVHCLDAHTGQIRWSYLTGGPVRLAPSVVDGRVYFGSDDGHVYCVNAADGSLIWRLPAGPSDSRLIAGGWMSSRWPVRTDVLVDDGVAYFGAGVFPHEGVYISAVDATDGTLLWRNDNTPTAAARGLSGGPGGTELSPQGYLLASDSRLFVPSGRALPAAFDRECGRQLFQARDSWRTSGIVGGTFAVLAHDHILVGANQAVGYEQETGRSGFAWFPCRRIVVADDVAYMTTDQVPTDTSGPALEAVVQRVSYEPYAEATRERRGLLRDIRTIEGRQRTANTALRAENRKDEEERDADEIAKLTAQIEEFTAAINAAQERVEEISEIDLQAQITWSAPTDCASSLIVAGNTVFAGGPGLVVAHDATSGEELWRAEVEGDAQGLAAAGGALYVTTDAGLLYCFASGAGDPGPIIDQQPQGSFPDQGPMAEVYRQAAEEIVRASGVNRGFALVAGVETGRLAMELAQRTELKIYCLEPDAARVQAAREALTAAGVYGSRVFVDQADFDAIPYSNYFANLVVSERPLHGAPPPDLTPDLVRKLKPMGGVAFVGAPEGVAGAPDADALASWLRGFGVGEPQMREGGRWAMLVRGALPGAGSWTHQYADPGNTACSTDQLRAPLRLLWYGDPGPDKMVTRHARSVAPLSVDGLMLMQGSNVLMCYDAYNGLMYWERELEGAERTAMHRRASNVCANSSHLYVAIGEHCLQLDVRTGETLRVIEQPGPAPDDPPNWGWIATVDDLLYGSSSIDAADSNRIFALDAVSGEERWTYEGTRITDNTIAISNGRLLFADAVPLGPEQRRQAVPEGDDPDAADVRMVICLDAATGEKLWERPTDLTDCGAERGVLMAMSADGVLVFSAAHWNGHYWSQFLSGDYGLRRAVALGTSDGSLLWDQRLGYRIRPLIVGGQFIGEPWSFDLRTGEQLLTAHPLTGEQVPWQFERPGHHCGGISAAENLLMFRSSYLGYYDLVNDFGSAHFGAQRPGCWINAIAANGVVLVPEASSGCQCLYAVQCSLAFEPVAEEQAWGIYSAPGPHVPIREVSLNFGAPGDRRADDGTLWLSWPRPTSRMGISVDLKAALLEDGEYFAGDTRLANGNGSVTPWLYASGVRGVESLSLPLVGRGDAPSGYMVRMHFTSTGPNGRVTLFDINLQGETVATAVNLNVGEPGHPMVHEFGPVPVRGDLEIAFVAQGAEPTAEESAPLCALELVRVPLPEIDQAVQTLTEPLEPHNLGYWLADILRSATESDIALLPSSSLIVNGPLPAGEVTLGALLGRIADTPLVRHEVTGAELLAYFGDPRIADRLNPLSHGRASEASNSIYYSGFEVAWRPDEARVAVSIDPGKRYTLVAPHPFDAAEGALPGESLGGTVAIAGLQTDAASTLERSTWDLLEGVVRSGSGLTVRYPEPLEVWAQWLEQSRQAMGYHLKEWPTDLPTVTIDASADTSVTASSPERNYGADLLLRNDGGDREMGDDRYAIAYLRFPLDIPGRPVMAMLRLRTHDGSNSQSADAGMVHIVEAPWDEATMTFPDRPTYGEWVGALAQVDLGQLVERVLLIDLRGRSEVSIALVPTTVDAAIFRSRESDDPPQLIVAYEPE